MPVVALSEKGLIIDVFGDKPKVIKSHHYTTQNNRLITVYNSTMRFVDLVSLEMSEEIVLPGFSSAKMSADGSRAIVMCYHKTAHVYKDKKKTAELENVDEYSVSDSFYAYISSGNLTICNFENEVLHRVSGVKSVYCLNTLVLFVQKTESGDKLMMAKDKIYTLLSHPEIFRMLIEHTKDEKHILVLLDLEYSNKSYYAESSLYLLSSESGTAKREEPVEVAQDSPYKLFLYQLVKKIHCFKFVKDGFFVCFGNQPSNLHLYSFEGDYVRKYPKIARNRVAFNASGTRILNAGLGNLPGVIEVYDGTTTCKFESLGCSDLEWMNDGTRFMVATTSYFKSDNMVTIYDYYGRALERMECSSLTSAHVYGVEEPEYSIDGPKLGIKKEQVYVPPNLSSMQYKSVQQPPKPKKGKPKVAESCEDKNEVTKEQLEEKLKKCEELKKRVEKGEDLTVEEHNSLFEMNKIKEDLLQFK